MYSWVSIISIVSIKHISWTILERSLLNVLYDPIKHQTYRVSIKHTGLKSLYKNELSFTDLH